MQKPPVLILGAGINGAAIARELLLNRVPVCLVDSADLAGGTTAYSSRLIHGGLRYLEYGEWKLVRESLAERSRLLTLAPHLVRPLRLYIPVASRAGGLLEAAARLLRLPAHRRLAAPRGLWLVQLGLWLYDTYARQQRLERRATHSRDDPRVPQVNRQRCRWLCAYTDAQIAFPERMVVALLADCRRLAQQHGVAFGLFTYHQVSRQGDLVQVIGEGGEQAMELSPRAVINATGAWVDRTLQRLKIPSRQLIGGTKGSHFLTFHEGLRGLLGGQGVYAEAADGRPVFVLPLGRATLVGTTDVVYEGLPEVAVASPPELDYLRATVNELFPQLGLTPDDIYLHYSGVRPLPFTGATTPAAITRRHFVHRHADLDPPVFSVIGGKLTTCRSLAEVAARAVLAQLGQTPITDSRNRPLPGAEGFPADADQLQRELQRLAAAAGASPRQVETVWALYGTQTQRILGPPPDSPRENVVGTALPVDLVRRVIREEWVRRLADLVERRLMLLYDRGLTLATLRKLAQVMWEEGVISEDRIECEVSACAERLAAHFGLVLGDEE